MMALRLHDALERCETLPHSFRARDLAGVGITGPTGVSGWRESRAMAHRVKDRPMQLACAWALRPHPLLAVRTGSDASGPGHRPEPDVTRSRSSTSLTDETSLTFTVLVDGERFEAYLRANRSLVTDRVDPVVPVALLAAMRRRQPLHLPGPVSAGLLGHLDRAQDVLQSFSRGPLARTPVVAEPAPPPAPGDRCWVLLQRRRRRVLQRAQRHEDVTHLVFVVGLATFDLDVGVRPGGVSSPPGRRATRSARSSSRSRRTSRR